MTMKELQDRNISAEVLPGFTTAKIFLWALFLIPVALITHIVCATLQIFTIPSKVIDIITTVEKQKQFLKKKRLTNATI